MKGALSLKGKGKDIVEKNGGTLLERGENGGHAGKSVLRG